MSDETIDESWQAASAILAQGRLSVLMPAYRLGEQIAENVRRVAAAYRGRFPFEIIVIDDGSEDGTVEQLNAVHDECPELQVVPLARNVGKGEALRRGFAQVTGTHVLFLDADMDLPPEQVNVFFDEMQRSDSDVVIGAKLHPDSQLDYPLKRRIITRSYFLLVKLLIGLPVRDTQTGLKLFKREVLDWVFPRILVKAFAFDLEILATAFHHGWKITDAPVRVEYGQRYGWVGPSAIRTTLNDTLAVFYRTRMLNYYESIPDLHPPDPLPRVSVVIAYPVPTPNLRECLDALARVKYPHLEIVLLPDTGSDEVWPDGTREIPTGAVRPAEKRNIGSREASGEIIAFLDDDAYPVAHWLNHAIPHFGNPDVAAVGGPGITPPNEPFWESLSGQVYENAFVSAGYRYRYISERVRDVDDYPSCNLLVRKSAMEAIGGFRTEYWPGEDTYLCLDIVKTLKQRIVYEPWAIVFHHRRGLFLPHLRQVARYALHRGYFARHFPETSRKLGYFVPSLFVLGLLGGGASYALLPDVLRIVYLGVVALYLALTGLSSIMRRPSAFIFVWAGVVATHLVYGTRFLLGLFVKRLPGQVADFDHSSEASESL